MKEKEGIHINESYWRNMTPAELENFAEIIFNEGIEKAITSALN